ncbi:hypothetical protein [Hoeflea ulvae]|uniref:Uncharacterized protein n=1 Tax=Hoeflea ulvae TaxID=2983764 RepID=A0ABT3YBJ2_9HYPH|nr:hypothetical protein [Hoeflea ulvae]MCY0093177.1 hypothetical protein [Hoeflea ulvae]
MNGICGGMQMLGLARHARQSYGRTMKLFLSIIAAICFAGPVAGWAYIVALASSHNLGSPNRGVGLADYWDGEFLMLAAVPWLISAICLFLALRPQ